MTTKILRAVKSAGCRESGKASELRFGPRERPWRAPRECQAETRDASPGTLQVAAT